MKDEVISIGCTYPLKRPINGGYHKWEGAIGRDTG